MCIRDRDYFVVSEQLGCVTESVCITPGYCSDHSLVCFTFKTDIVKRHTLFWGKFNNSLLRDIVFVSLVKQVILDLKKQYAVPVYDKENIHLICDEDHTLMIDDQLFFEMILLEIRGKCISHATYKKKEMAKSETEIITNSLKRALTKTMYNFCNKKEPFEIRQIKVDGMIIRSRAKWIGDGEKNSKYFCKLEKINFVQRSMCFIQKDNGEIIHDSKSVTSEATVLCPKGSRYSR